MVTTEMNSSTLQQSPHASADSLHSNQEPDLIAQPADNALPLRVRTLRTEEDLRSIDSTWAELAQSPNADPAFYRTVLDTSASIKHPFVLVIEQGSTIKALLIGRVEEIRLDIKLGYFSLPSPKVRALVFIYGGLLGDPDESACRLLVDAITASLSKGEASVAMFNHLRADSPLYPLIANHPAFMMRDRCSTLATHRRVTVRDNVADFWAKLTYKARGNLRWNVKTFLKSYADSHTIECYTEPSQMDEMASKLEKIASKTYQRGLGVGFSNSDSELVRMRQKAELGWLRNYILSVNGEPVGFFCGTIYAGIFHGDHMGFDPEYRRSSPGIFLTIRVIEGFCENKSPDLVRFVDFGLGDARYKAEISDIEFNDAVIYLFAPTLGGALLNLYRTPALLLDRLARRIFNPMTQEKIKRFWRKLLRKETQPAKGDAKGEAKDKSSKESKKS